MNCLCETNQSFKFSKYNVYWFIEEDEHNFKKVIINVLPHKCPLYHPFSLKDFSISVHEWRLWRRVPLPWNILCPHTPTQSPDIFFSYAFLKNTGSNFCAYMYMGYFLLFRPFSVTVQETMTTPSTLGSSPKVFGVVIGCEEILCFECVFRYLF